MGRAISVFTRVVTLLSCLPFFCSAALSAVNAGGVVQMRSSLIIDPDIIDSEFNHRVAGYALVLMGALIIASLSSPRLRVLRFVWPLIFISFGIFLATWSDKEIWPRGSLPWTWLLSHDPEARQHKIYAILMIAMGIFELQRSREKLGEFWRRWSLPVLAAFGAIFLLFHAHGGGTGLPHGWDEAEKQAKIAAMPLQAGLPEISTAGSVVPNATTASHTQGEMTMDSSMHDHGAMHQSSGEKSPTSNAAADPPDASTSGHAGHNGGGHAEHPMTPAMLHIKNEHLWYTILGLAIALFKFIADGDSIRTRVVQYLWPGTMIVLGILLTTFTEL